MAITLTPRFSLTQWGLESDAPSRAQFEQSFQNIDTLGAIDIQGLASSRPVAGTAGRYYWATDTSILSRDNGTAWVQINGPVTTQIPHSWELSGGDQVALGANGYVGPMFVPVPPGQTATLAAVVAKVRSGSVSFQMNLNGVAIPGIGGAGGATITATTTPTGRLLPSPAVSFNDLDQLAPIITQVSGAPDGLTVSAFIAYTSE